MATVHYRNAFFAVNGTDLSANASEVTLNYSSETLDATAMGDTTRKKKGGLFNWSASVKFHQDFTAGAVDATLFNLLGTTSCIEIRPNNACSSASNPSYSGVGTLSSYPPVGGAVGTLLDVQAQWDSYSALSRASSS